MPDLAVREMENQLATLEQELKAVYRERDHLIATLSAFLPATMAPSAYPDWSLLALPVDEDVTLYWNVAAENADLFPHVPAPLGVLETDGRSTDEKYAVLREVTATMAEVVQELNVAGLSDLLFAAVGEDVTENVAETVLNLPEPEAVHDQAAPEPELVHDEAPDFLAPTPAPLPKRNPRAKKAGA